MEGLFCPEHDLKAGEKDAFVAAIKSAFPELRRDRQSVAGKQVRDSSASKSR